MNADNNRTAKLPLSADDEVTLDEPSPELIEWLFAYFDYLVGDESTPSPEPPAGLAKEAARLGEMLRANYGFAIDPIAKQSSNTTSSAATPHDTSLQLEACISAAAPPQRPILGDSHVPRLLLFKWTKAKRKSVEVRLLRRTNAIASWLTSRGIRPIWGPVIATALAPLAGWLILTHRLLLAALCMTFLPAFELIDTALAKCARNPRRAVLFDQVGDRASDLLIFGALAIFGFHHDIWTGVAAVITMSAGMISSYLWAMAAALRLPPPAAHVGRAERILALTTGTWMSLFFPIGALRIGVIVAAVLILIALLERALDVMGTSPALQPQWIGSSTYTWDPDEFIPRIAEQLQRDSSKLVVIHTTGAYKGPNEHTDVVAVVQRRGDQRRGDRVCVEYFHPPTGPAVTNPDPERRSTGGLSA